MGATRTPTGFPLQDWPKKKKDLHELTSTSTQEALIQAIYGGKAGYTAEFVKRTYKWTKPGFVTQDTEFFEKAKRILGCDPIIPASRLIECSHKEWRSLMGIEQRTALVSKTRTGFTPFLV